MADDNIQRRIILDLIYLEEVNKFLKGLKESKFVPESICESIQYSLTSKLEQAVELGMDKMRYSIGGIIPGVTIEVGTYISALKEKYESILSKNLTKK